jgi:UDP-N-acetylmuramoyl-tripeptide--D-alanyl-D-alanine ligase
MTINLVINKIPVLFELPSSHESYPINLAAACALSYAAGIEVSTMTKSLANFSGADGRFQTITTSRLIIIDDSYNASPESMAAGIRTCKKLYPDKKTIAILGDMKELGDDSEKLHLAMGALCFKEMAPDLLITVGKDGEKIAEGAKKAGLAKDKVLSFADVSEVTRLPDKIFLKRQLVFLKASHSMEFSKIVEALRKLA